MPTYEYRCPRGHAFEKFSPRMTSHPSATCPKCGKRARRLISGGAGLVFKGSGFYITDYKRSGEKRDTDTSDAKAHDATKSRNASEKASEKKSEKKSQKKDSGDK
jgi:putative FmdB family regulatory protein